MRSPHMQQRELGGLSPAGTSVHMGASRRTPSCSSLPSGHWPGGTSSPRPAAAHNNCRPALLHRTQTATALSSAPATPASKEFRAPRSMQRGAAAGGTIPTTPVSQHRAPRGAAATPVPGTPGDVGEHRTARVRHSEASYAPRVAAPGKSPGTPSGPGEFRATRPRKSEPPQTPGTEHREMAQQHGSWGPSYVGPGDMQQQRRHPTQVADGVASCGSGARGQQLPPHGRGFGHPGAAALRSQRPHGGGLAAAAAAAATPGMGRPGHSQRQPAPPVAAAPPVSSPRRGTSPTGHQQAGGGGVETGRTRPRRHSASIAAPASGTSATVSSSPCSGCTSPVAQQSPTASLQGEPLGAGSRRGGVDPTRGPIPEGYNVSDTMALTMTLSGTERLERVEPAPEPPVLSHGGSDCGEIDNNEAVQQTASMLPLPPTPDNTLLEFLEGIVSGCIEPALCCSGPSLDAPRYWDKRRVQNSLRRLLEALQQVFGADNCSQTGELADAVFGHLLNATGRRSALDERSFERGIDALGAWPPELSSADRAEVFAALRAPTTVSMRALSAGQPLPAEVSRRMFKQAFAHVPYNVPDFPVPAHILDAGERCAGRLRNVSEVAEAIAEVFCMEQVGLERVKDFFLCGAISLEEIQAALPQLVAESLVEEAVISVIRVGSARFTQREWSALVLSPHGISDEDMVATKLPESPGHGPVVAQEVTMPGLRSPSPQHRHLPMVTEKDTLHMEQSDARNGQLPPCTELAEGAEAAAAEAAAEASVAVSVSASCREIRSEEAVRFHGSHSRLINWTTSVGSQRDTTLQADESSAVTRSHALQAHTPKLSSQCSMVPGDEAVKRISLGMHNECLGPFLVRAFVRCCQLYEARP
mmetsp:Transcript_37408/g.74181  ORF Transcript_37408/g.74181 Transcript_37408/m.74181 type:complete len:871 (+) Transcript_37408:42-2654(+)